MPWSHPDSDSDYESVTSTVSIQPPSEPSSDPPLFGVHEFANAENVEHCAKYLNRTLATSGFPASLDLFSSDPVTIARTCNCIYSLLQERQRDSAFRVSTNDQRQRLQSDISLLEIKVERLKAQISAKDRELATLSRAEAKATAVFKSQIEKLQQERDEFQRKIIGNQQVRTQHIHEMKKKEKEYIKLQEKLNQVLMEKKKESRSGVEIMNLVQQKEGRQHGTGNRKKADNDFNKIIVAYEAKKQELMTENSDLRALLCSLQMDMRDLLNAPNGLPRALPISGKQDAGSPQPPEGGKKEVSNMPFHIARDQIEETVLTKMASIKEPTVHIQDAYEGADVTAEATERELEPEAKLVEARSIIQEQECTIHIKGAHEGADMTSEATKRELELFLSKLELDAQLVEARSIVQEEVLNAHEGAEATSEDIEKELELEARLVEAKGIVQELVLDAEEGADVTSEATERELEVEAQFVEAKSILQEQVLDAHEGADVTSEATERELELEAQLVEAKSIVQELVLDAEAGADITSEATERELEVKAQLVEAKTILQEQVLDAHEGADATSEATERELELEAQLVEAKGIVQELVLDAEEGAEVTPEATERELEVEAQLVEAKIILQEQEIEPDGERQNIHPGSSELA